MNKTVLGCVSICCAISLNAQAGDDEFCRTISNDLTSWVIKTQQKNSQRNIDKIQTENAKVQEYKSVTNRMTARANMLLDKNLTDREIKADLYGLCMSLT